MSRFSRMFVALLLFATLVSLSTLPVSAQDVTYTSTADFDSGTKSQPSPADGNYEVETNTDNLGIAAGGFELTSLKGDSFTLADADADTFKWNVFTEFAACSGRTQIIQNGILDVDVASNGAAGCRGGAVTTGTFSGDWDIRVEIDKTADTGNINLLELSLFNVASSFCRASPQDGLHYREQDGIIQAFTCVDGSYVQVGDNTGTVDPLHLRITRATNTFTFYYSSNGVDWTQDEQTTNASIPNPIYAYLTIAAFAVGGITGGDFDDFHLASGTVDAGGYRTSGDWISPTFNVPSSERVETITLTHSGLSATYYIDTVELRDSAGTVVVSWTDNIVSGASTILTTTDQTNGDMSVRVYLAGDNAGTPVLEAVAVDYVVTDGGGSIITPEDVSLDCTVRWPEMVLSCRASEEEVFVQIANGIRSREWFVDGQLVPGSGTFIEHTIDRPWWSAELHRYQVAYKAYGNENVIGFAQTVAVLDMRSFVLLPLAFIAIVGAMWGTSKRMTSRHGSEDGDGDRGPPVRRRRKR